MATLLCSSIKRPLWNRPSSRESESNVVQELNHIEAPFNTVVVASSTPRLGRVSFEIWQYLMKPFRLAGVGQRGYLSKESLCWPVVGACSSPPRRPKPPRELPASIFIDEGPPAMPTDKIIYLEPSACPEGCGLMLSKQRETVADRVAGRINLEAHRTRAISRVACQITSGKQIWCYSGCHMLFVAYSTKRATLPLMEPSTTSTTP
ncbi:hypothetical protein LshimejAT787_0202380 [Lyophyllum shimeji]|uniref:Uncharacterized protein n=1 Tax=Lyophyllum shimeji TaxID=47721 RepID=A0A9P3UIN8_LYOSH|nr:hypothetical protein LshimejAT787_0202380 [Lyophyllum shimeji]